MSEARREGPAASRPGPVGVVLASVLAAVGGGTEPRVLDCGGGSGTFAVPLAEAGAHVTVVDISGDALATLSRRAAEAGVAERVTPVAGDVEALQAALPAADPAGFDLALAHGILDAVDDPESTFAAIAAAVRPGGLLSVLVANPVAVVLARALAGDFAVAHRELDRLPAEPGADLVRDRCVRHGLVVERVQGVGVFTDLVSGSSLDAPGARAALTALEAACATRSPFADIAARTHVLARRPLAGTDAP